MSKTKQKNDPGQPEEKAHALQAGGSPGFASSSDSSPDVASVDKIRDIIFGNQMRDYEKRFNRLEERLMKEINELRDESARRVDSIEAYIKKEIESVSDRLKSEQDARAESIKLFSKEIGDTAQSLSKEIERLGEQQSKESRDLRQQLLDQSKVLSEEIRAKNKDASAALDQAFQELRTEKVDRSTLSELLMDMAFRMSNELAAKVTPERKDEENA